MTRPPSSLLDDLRPGIAALPASPIAQIADYGRHRDGLIPLWFGEGDVPSPAIVGDTAAQAIRDGHVFYTYQAGLPVLRQALAAYLARVYTTDVAVERITVTSSGMTAIMMAVQALVDPGDEVAVVSPVWPNITAAVRVMGGRPVPVPLDRTPGGWTLDLDRLFAACGPRTRALFINSPNNPTGWVMGREDMVRVMDFARARGLWVIADEVYGRLVYSDAVAAPSFLQVSAPDDRLIVVNSFSKNWAMTGWRLGWMVAPAPLLPVLENLVQYSTSGTPAFIQLAGVAALEHGEPFIEETRARCTAARERVFATLARLPRVTATPAHGAFYAFFTVDGEPDSVALARRVVDEAAVGLAPGIAFGDAGEGALRLCYATSLDRLDTAMARLERMLA